MRKILSDINPHEAEAIVRQMGGDKAADHYGVPRSTFKDWLKRNDLATRKDPTFDSSVVMTSQSVEVTSEASPDISDPEKIVRDRGLDPDEWDFAGLVVNEWDSPTGEKLNQLKVNLRRKENPELILPARTDGPVWKKPKKKAISKDGSLFVFVGDPQAPHHDRRLHDKLCNFLEEQQPHTIVNMGDTNDMPTLSRYKANPEKERDAQVNQCIDAGYGIYRDQRTAAPDANIIKMIGNHDVRLRDIVLEKVPELHGLKRAKIEGQEEPSVLSVQFLQRLDELGVECVGDLASYEHGQYKVSPYLAARHGWIATKGSGSSALKTLEHLGFSIIVGHTHRLSLVHKTMHDIDMQSLKVLAAAESGCTCVVEGDGLGYTPTPDWQQGYATATVYPDGFFKIDLANYIDGDILWRDNRY